MEQARTTSAVAVVPQWARLPARMERVAFVTPPSPQPILRDFYSTSRSKGAYNWAPIDLWVQGALLEPLVETRMFEGAGRRSGDLLDALAAYAPDLIVSLIGGFSEFTDTAFLDAAATRTGAPVAVGGEAVMRGWSHWAPHPWAAGLLYPFTGTALRDAVRAGRGLPSLPMPARAVWGRPPDWSLAPYRYPLLGRPVASVLTAHGCPFRCSYCNNNRDVLGLDLRDEDDLFAELETWAARGVRWLHVRDVNFGGPLPRAKAILSRWADARLPLRFSCFLRPETIDDETADLLAAAGCVQVQMGVESASATSLAAVRRGGNAEAVAAAFRRLDRRRIRRGAHFVLGLPGEGEADLAATIRLARRLDPDYASFNIGVVRAGAGFSGAAGDCSSGEGALIGDLPRHVLARWRRRASLRVHLSPRYLLRSVRSGLRDPATMARRIREGWGLLTTGPGLDTRGGPA
jgi:hypothetical protein